MVDHLVNYKFDARALFLAGTFLGKQRQHSLKRTKSTCFKRTQAERRASI